MGHERQPSRFEAIHIEYIGEVPTGHVVELIDEMSHDCMDVYVRRRVFNIGAGGPGFLEAGVIIAVSIASASFLSELGKDAYSAVKEVLKRLYRRRKGLMTAHGFYHPLEVQAKTAEGAEFRFLFE